MGGGDGFGQTEDHMGGGVGGAVVVGASLGDDGDGVGVEAAAVVVITLLAVLGNAMVVATLVRRSLLHHPSNRLVLSLTGSNLLLTVVVLPGMVTSLLMTPASPNNQSPTLSQPFNDSSAAQDTIDPLTLFGSEQREASDLLQHPNSVISPDQPHASSLQGNKKESSNIPQHNASSIGYDKGAVTLSPFVDPEVPSTVSEYFTTEIPLYLRVSSDGLDPSVYSHRDVSVLSQEVKGSHHSPLQHGAAGPLSLEEQEVKHLHQTLTIDDENELTSVPNDNFSEIGPELAELHQKQNISIIQDHKNDKIQVSQTEEIKSGMVKSQNRKSPIENESNGDLKTEIKSFTRNERKANFPQPDNQHSKRKSNFYVSIKVNHQDVPQEIKRRDEHSDIYQQEIVSLTHKSKLSNHQQETEIHAPSRRRRKQAPRHYQHRKQRLRRIRADPGDESRDQHLHDRVTSVDDIETSDIQGVLLGEKSLSFTLNKINEENDIEDVDGAGISIKRINDIRQNENGEEHTQETVQLQIREQSRREESSGEEEHLILVRGVQETEEAQEKKVLLLVVDQEFDQKKRVDVKLEQRLDDLYQRMNEPDLPREEVKIKEKQDHTIDRLPKLAALNQKSGVYLKENEHENQVNQTESEKRPVDDHHHQEGQLHEFQAQALELRGNRETTVDWQNYLKAEREVVEKEGDSDETKTSSASAEDVQQMYGGIEWESERWEGGRILCQGAAFFTNLVTAASALTVAVIAIDRYLAIVRPLVYGVMVTRGRCLLMLIWCWSQAFLTALPPLLGWARYERREPYGRCGVAWGESPSYTACWTISVFLIPFSIMTVCYYHILQVARNKCRRIRVGKVSENSPPNTPDPASACLDGFPFPLSVAHLMAPPLGSKLVSARPPSPMLTKLPSLGNLANPPVERQVSYPPGNHTSHPLVRNTARGLIDSRLDGMPCRSHSVSGMLRAVDSTSTNPNDSANKPKRKLGNFGRSRSLCQVPQQPPRPCLRRVQSTFSVRHTLKKLSLGTRRPSWNWEGSPSKGFWTVFVVMGAHLLTWGPYSCMAVAEAILGHNHLLIIPHWVMVTCTLLLFTASVFYPIVYGLYNRNIRKEILTCLCPSWTRKRGSQARRPSTLPSYTGSVLDFTSLHHRSAVDKPDFGYNPANGIMGPIATISSRVGSLACPAPLMLMGEDDPLPARGYNLNLRKPSQDSGTVMVGSEDQDSDVDTPAPTPRQYTTRRVSAPSVLSTVCEDPHTTTVCIEETPQVMRHHSINCRNVPQRKNAIFPLSEPLSFKRVVSSSLRRSRSLDKISSSEKEITLDSAMTYRSLRKKHSTPIMRETQFNTPTPTPTPTTSERVQRRRGSIAVMKVTAIPEDCGLMEYPEVTDSGRGSVDSGRVSRHRMMHGRGSTDSTDLTKTFSLRCRGSIDSAEHAKAQGFSRRGSMDSTELAIARNKKRENRDGLDLGKNPATRQVSIDEGIGSECLPEESNWE